ncbi:hypothetical protein M422DRAFT_271531 [Sphaerobolus stellatus SS14]|uniref:Gamma-glutamyltransferase n=1 Tax=Sphaerobolus stellatus (strain SS14) TaxID=990650 RepID=A0A0C9UPA8_SPHS4|nr:hypothetical protein M422DRAFT_271531 [Sphaerobolus stellatus SS14]
MSRIIIFVFALLPLSLAASTTAITNHGAVVTEVAECSDIGVQILKQGGSAADAIIASAFCVGTISAYHSGIGGGGFMLQNP